MPQYFDSIPKNLEEWVSFIFLLRSPAFHTPLFLSSKEDCAHDHSFCHLHPTPPTALSLLLPSPTHLLSPTTPDFLIPSSQQALAQPLFFTASAPLHNSHTHVNVSPKGLPAASLSVFDPNHAAYVDGTGSGCETIAHAYENGRVTVMFCSFEKNPRILRWFCGGG